MDFLGPVPGKDGKKLFVSGGSDVRARSLRPKSGEFVPFMSGISAEGLMLLQRRQWVTYTSIPGGESLEK